MSDRAREQLLCGATTTVPVYDRTVICELEHGHTGSHHGHIEPGVERGSYHYSGPLSWDWTDEERT